MPILQVHFRRLKELSLPLVQPNNYDNTRTPGGPSLGLLRETLDLEEGEMVANSHPEPNSVLCGQFPHRLSPAWRLAPEEEAEALLQALGHPLCPSTSSIHVEFCIWWKVARRCSDAGWWLLGTQEAGLVAAPPGERSGGYPRSFLQE